MAISGFLFLSWRLFEIIMLIPPLGMLAYFIHGYVSNDALTPTFILLLFIVVTLALAWAVFTTIAYLRARHDALFVAFVDLGFLGALIAGVALLGPIGGADCSDNQFANNPLWQRLGVFGLAGYAAQPRNAYAQDINKNCSLLKASFAFAIINILAFFVTFIFALLVYRHHKDDDKVIVKREYRSSHHSSRHRSGSRSGAPMSRRAPSRGGGGARSDYTYDRPRSNSYRESGTRRSASRRRDYYV